MGTPLQYMKQKHKFIVDPMKNFKILKADPKFWEMKLREELYIVKHI